MAKQQGTYTREFKLEVTRQERDILKPWGQSSHTKSLDPSIL